MGRHEAGRESRLYAGTARVEITPPPEAAVNLSNGPMKAFDRLFARVVVLKNAETSLAIVSLDLILFASRKVVAEARARHHVDHVILASTHTHAAPAPEGLRIKPPLGDWTRRGDPGRELDWDALSADPWYAATEEKILDAIGEAMGHLFPATIRAGRAPFECAYMAHNRRLVQEGVFKKMLWDNPTLIPTQPLDPTMGVVRINDGNGAARALLVHYACHPVGMMGSGLVSRDFPGVMCDDIERELGPDCMALFLQGAQGDLDPYHLGLQGEPRLNVVREAGLALAHAALSLAESLRREPARPSASLRVKEVVTTIPDRAGRTTSEVGLTVAVVNDQVALVSLPGEPFIQHQLDLRAESPIPDTWLLGLAYNGTGSPFLVYVPTAEAVRQGGYGATECSFVGAGAGRQMIEEAVGALKGLSRAADALTPVVSSSDAVVTWPMPLTEKPFPLYTVEVNAVAVPVWTARVREEIHISSHMLNGRTDWCGFARFDFAGLADVTVVVERDFRGAEVVPRSAGITPTVEGRTIRFRMREPRPLTLLLDGQDAEPLHLFTHRPETDVPASGDPTVIYFGPGEHWVDSIKVRSGQTVYLDGGAIVRGVLPAGAKGVPHPVLQAVSYSGRVIDVTGAQDVRIRGRGILDGTLLPHPGPGLIGLARSSRVHIAGITLRNSANWHLPILDCEDVTVEGVCGISGRLNSDGINCVSSRRIRVRDCFMRSHDDTFAVKTMLPDRPSQDIRYERCVAWNDWGFGLGVTYETRADIRDVHFSDCDVIFARNWPIGIHAADGGTVEDICFERVTVDYPRTSIGAGPCMNRALVRIDNGKDEWATDPAIGHVRRITLRDIDVRGHHVPVIEIRGQDAAHPLEDIRLENVTLNGRHLDAADPTHVRTNAHVRGVVIQPEG